MLILILVVIITSMSQSLTADCKEAYSNYIYDNEKRARIEPDAFVPEIIYTGADIGAGDFSEPKDLHIAKDGKIYIADTKNNRIVVLNSDFTLNRIVEEFSTNNSIEKFDNPSGVFVTQDKILYVADTGNKRVVALNDKNELVRLVAAPVSARIPREFTYEPVRIAVDSANRLFVVSKNANQGMIEFDNEVNFTSFFGAIRVVPDLSQLFWKMIATKEQRERMNLTVPTEYSSLDIDDEGFIYGTVSAINVDNGIDTNMFIHKLNPMGIDVLKRNGVTSPMGDVDYIVKYKPVPSALTDIAVQRYGIYSALDSRRGRVFTYSENGELLYVFGGLGKHFGQFGMPEALDIQSDGSFLVLDSKYNWITKFKPTKYAQLINNAIISQINRKYEQADTYWQEALKYTSRSDLVFNGIADSLTKNEEYKNALKFYQIANNRTDYSKAFSGYRDSVLAKYFATIVIGMIIMVILIITALKIRKHIKERGKNNG